MVELLTVHRETPVTFQVKHKGSWKVFVAVLFVHLLKSHDISSKSAQLQFMLEV